MTNFVIVPTRFYYLLDFRFPPYFLPINENETPDSFRACPNNPSSLGDRNKKCQQEV